MCWNPTQSAKVAPPGNPHSAKVPPPSLAPVSPCTCSSSPRARGSSWGGSFGRQAPGRQRPQISATLRALLSAGSGWPQRSNPGSAWGPQRGARGTSAARGPALVRGGGRRRKGGGGYLGTPGRAPPPEGRAYLRRAGGQWAGVSPEPTLRSQPPQLLPQPQPGQPLAPPWRRGWLLFDLCLHSAFSMLLIQGAFRFSVLSRAPSASPGLFALGPTGPGVLWLP